MRTHRGRSSDRNGDVRRAMTSNVRPEHRTCTPVYLSMGCSHVNPPSAAKLTNRHPDLSAIYFNRSQQERAS